ncbi:MAG TPA: hypothetical protein VFQ13_16455 [Anaerolineales bacterium]|nr:hypothetical protein [Anaerolineales bacterium]
MCKTILKLLTGFVLLVASQACASPSPAAPDPITINTAIAQTFAAALTQTSQPGIPVTGPESPTPTATTALSPTPSSAMILPAMNSAQQSRYVPTPGKAARV